MNRSFRTFFLALSEEERSQFAAMAETSVIYILRHLIRPNLESRKTPKRKTMKLLAKAAQKFSTEQNPAPSSQELLNFFFDMPEAA